jgi:hypothetical protein
MNGLTVVRTDEGKPVEQTSVGVFALRSGGLISMSHLAIGRSERGTSAWPK